MPYLAESDRLAKIPAATLLEALDDNADGTADTGLLDAIITSACEKIDGQLSANYAVPFVAVPPLVKHAAVIFVLEMLYERRGWVDPKNPWSAKARELRTQIKEVAKGSRPLFPAIDKLNGQVGILSEASRLTGDTQPPLDL